MLMLTLTLAGVLPDAGLTTSQPGELATAVKLSGEPPELTLSVCATGVAEPGCQVKFSGVGVTNNAGASVTTRVTLTFCGLLEAPADVMVIVPL